MDPSVSSSPSLLEKIQHQLEVDYNKFTNQLMQDLVFYRQLPFTISHERVCKSLQLPPCKELLCVCHSRMEMALHSQFEEKTAESKINSLIHMVNSFSVRDGRITKVLKLLMMLFTHHTRHLAFEKQREVALKLYTPFLKGETIPLWPLKEERFILWTVCSLQLQVLFGDYLGEDIVALSISLLKEHLESKGLLLPEGPLLYISIMEEQAMYAEALDFLSSLGNDNVDYLRIKGRLLACRQDYASAAEVFQAVLVRCPDDWGCFINYLNTLLEVDNMWHDGPKHDQIYLPQLVDRKLSTLSDAEFDLRMSKASDFIEELNVVADGNISFRDTAFMEIETRRILQHRSNGDALILNLENLFRRFGYLASFTSIMLYFMKNLTCSIVQKLLKRSKGVSGSDTDDDGSLLILLRSTSLLKVQEELLFRFDCVTFLDSVEDFSVLIMSYMGTSQYISGQRSLGLLSQSAYKDGIILTGELPSMACNILVQLFWRTQKIGFLLEAILVLEFGLVMQRSNPQYITQLIHLYSHVGALKLAHERYKTLNIRGILMETWSHNILPQILTSPLWADALKLLEDYKAFMKNHLGDIADLTLHGYCYRDFPKVVECVKFRKLLQHSHNMVMARVEIPILHLKRKADDFGQVENHMCKVPLDLMELKWYARSEEALGYRRQHEHLKQITKRRGLIPHLIHLSIQRGLFMKDYITYGSSSTVTHNDVFSVILTEFAFNLLHGGVGDDRVKAQSIKRVTKYIGRVCRGEMQFKWPISDIIDWINFAVFLNAWTCGPLDRVHCHVFSPDEPPSGWQHVTIMMASFIEATIQAMQPLIGSPGNGSDFSLLVQLMTESLAWHVLVIRSFCAAVIPPAAVRKEPEFELQVHLYPVSYDMLGAIKALCKTISLVTAFLDRFISRLVGLEQCREEVKLDLDHGPGIVYELLKRKKVDDFWTCESADAIFSGLVKNQNETWSHLQSICISKRKLLHGLRKDLQKLL